MKRLKTGEFSRLTPVPLTASLCLTYLLMLLIIDYILLAVPVYRPSYYLINGLTTGTVLLVSLFLGKKCSESLLVLILIVGILSLLPLISSELFMTRHQLISDLGKAEYIMLRNLPFLLIGMILLVRKYGFPSVIIYSGIIIVLVLLLNSHRVVFGDRGLRPFGFLLFIYTIIFLITGYFLSNLMVKLRKRNEDLAQANARLADFAATQEELTISRERNRMARELHDTLAHTLSALSVQLETARAYNKIDPEATGAIIESSLTVTRSGLDETRKALKALRAAPLENLGLTLALEQLLRESAHRGNLKLHLEFSPEFPALTHSEEQCLYRITQEAAANVIFHSNGKNLSVKLTSDKGTTLTIEDDGDGFDPENCHKEGHYGIKGMKERATRAGGILDLISEPGKGTKVILTLGTDK
jgi:signal transduction histidine kinase